MNDRSQDGSEFHSRSPGSLEKIERSVILNKTNMRKIHLLY